MTKTNFQKIQYFHKVFGKIQDPETPTVQTYDITKLRAKLIFEEFMEVLEELGYDPDYFSGIHGEFAYLQSHFNPSKINLHKLAKELADLNYVTYGTGAAFGIPMDKVFAEVHNSNMSKLDEDGNVIRREDGKVLKSKLYLPANMKKIF